MKPSDGILQKLAEPGVRHLKNTYDGMWNSSVQRLLSGQLELDVAIDDPVDSRRGLSLVIRPDERVLRKLFTFLQAAKQLENKQHFYDAAEIHVTVMSIVRCSSGFNLQDINLSRYIEVVDECLAEIDRFEINFSGVTTSAACVLAQGFPSGGAMDQLRSSLQVKLVSSGLQSPVKERYPNRTSHSTLIRFRQQLAQPETFVSFLEGWRSASFGKTEVCSMMLVFNDWYHRKGVLQDLHKFAIPS